MPIKPLSFKGDKKTSKKRKHTSSTTPQTLADSTTADADDTWTYPTNPTDLSGPVLIVLPSPNTTPAALTADTQGSIFPTPLENLIEGDTLGHTAEPHDTRTVWICTALSGSLQNEVSFKGAHGGYLASDATTGKLSARREARGVEEGWVVELVSSEEDEEGQGGGEIHESKRSFRLRTAASLAKDAEAQYLTYTPTTKPPLHTTTLTPPPTSSKSASTHLILRMQSRFKPQLQAQKTQKASEKVSRRELEAAVGRRLEEDEVRRLKRARKEGTYHEEILDVRVKGKHDKFASS